MKILLIICVAVATVFSAKADTWYDDNGVTVEGSGSATVAYRSESSGVWLDITVAEGDTATLTSLSTTALSIQKLGAGYLAISSATAVSFLVEEGTLRIPGDNWGGHAANASAYTLTVHENGTVMAYSAHVPLPNVVMRGGRFVSYNVIPSNEQDLRIYKCWAMKHNIKVLPSQNGSPSVISGYACHIGHASYMPTFDIDAGAELQLDTMICNGWVSSGVPTASGFTKTGAGTLTFLRGGSITGTSTLKEGTLKFAAGASLGPDATLNTWAGTTIELADGAAFDTPVNSSLSCSAAEYAILTNCAIWVDAWQETAVEGASVNSIANRGTAGGAFAPPTSGSYTSPCTFTTNGVNGRPSYKFNGSNQSMQFSNLAYGTLDDPKHEMMILIAFERNSFVAWRGFFSFALSSNSSADYQSACTLRQQDDGEQWFGIYNQSASNDQVANVVNPHYATDGVPSVFSFYCNNYDLTTRLDYHPYYNSDPTYNSNHNTDRIFDIAFDRMSLGGRKGAGDATGDPWNGAIGEVIVCTNYNATTYNTILAYMKRKWHSGTKEKKGGVTIIRVPQGTASATSVGGLFDGQTPSLTKTGAGELMVGSVAADGDVVVSEGALSLIPTSVVSKIDVWMDAADEGTLTVENGEVVSVRNKGRAGGSFVRNPRYGGTSGTLCPNLPTLSTMNGHVALGFDGTSALVLDSYTNHNDDATYTVFVAARVGDGVDFADVDKGKDTSPFSMASVSNGYQDWVAPVGCHIEPKGNGDVAFFGAVKVSGSEYNAFNVSSSSLKAGAEFISVYYNHSHGAYAYLQTFTDGVAAESANASAHGNMRPYPAAIDVVSVGGRLGPNGTSYYYGSASEDRMWYGQVGELIVCTRQPTADERAAILNYLRAKWGLSGETPATPSAIVTDLAPSLDRNVKLTAAAGTELKSLTATQPLASLAVTGNATITRDGNATSAMFDISGDLLLPDSMTLRMLSEPAENTSMDIIICAGTGSGTAWSIEARKPSRWSVVTTQNAIRALYTKPGMVIIIE